MKVLLAVHRFFPEGAAGTEVLTLTLGQELGRRGHEVAVLAGRPDPTLPEDAPPRLEEDAHGGLRVLRLRYRPAKGVRWDTAAPDRVALVLDAVGRFGPGVVHFLHARGLSAAAVSAVAASGVPTLFTPTDYWAVCPRLTLFDEHRQAVCSGPRDGTPCVPCLRPDVPALGLPGVARAAIAAGRALRWTGGGAFADLAHLPERPGEMARTMNLCGRVLPATRFLADALVRHGVDAGRVEVVPYGTETGPAAERRPVPAAFTTDDPLRLVFMGTLMHLKGPQLLLEALEILGKSNRGRVHLDVYGRGREGDDFEGQLRQRAAQGGLPVAFHGNVPADQVGAALAAGHVVVVPSIWFESTPLVLLSALAIPVPVLVTDLGGMTEVVTPGVHGQWFKAGDAGDLARLVASLLDDAPGFAAMHAAMPRRDRTMAHYADDVEAAYRATAATRVDPSRGTRKR